MGIVSRHLGRSQKGPQRKYALTHAHHAGSNLHGEDHHREIHHVLEDLMLHSRTKVHHNSLLDGVQQVAHQNVHSPPTQAINRYHTFPRGSFQVAFKFLLGTLPSRHLIQGHVFLRDVLHKHSHMDRCVIFMHLGHRAHRTH